MPSSEDIAVRRAVVAAIDDLPRAPEHLRARTLAMFRREATTPTVSSQMSGKRVVALTLGFLPAIVAFPLAATLGIERPLSIRETVSQARSFRLLSRLIRIA